MEESVIRPIARYYGDLGEKFGVPRQAGVVEELEGCVVFEPRYLRPTAMGPGPVDGRRKPPVPRVVWETKRPSVFEKGTAYRAWPKRAPLGLRFVSV